MTPSELTYINKCTAPPLNASGSTVSIGLSDSALKNMKIITKIISRSKVCLIKAFLLIMM